MNRGRLFLALGVVGIAIVTFIVAFGLNGYLQVKETGQYIPPAALVDIIKLVLGASVSILTLGTIDEIKRLPRPQDYSHPLPADQGGTIKLPQPEKQEQHGQDQTK